ncbi:MAG: hypothetical protein A4E63_03034 [Syntrophorhabdus sp. PtaU1.Bin050]|nr:MAG: hypothetical protein A4E63_03034 [Syntrophorhabdus sp. PtaU1.Bin050]
MIEKDKEIVKMVAQIQALETQGVPRPEIEELKQGLQRIQDLKCKLAKIEGQTNPLIEQFIITLLGKLNKLFLMSKPHFRRGRKVLEGSTHSGQGRAAQLQEERTPVWEKWQEFADELWSKNRHLSVLEVARRCSAHFEGTEYQGSIRSIRNRITKH